MDLRNYSALGKKKDTKVNNNIGVMIYTRVSSKDQESNKSLVVQLEQAKKYASSNNYQVISEFGGTYESASGDFTRKEFSRLINEVRSMKQKPLAILLNTINRFSRSGGSAVGLATELVEELGVHIIDISTGKNTMTEEGKLEIYQGLLKAKQENIDRLKHTLPGMEKYLRLGNWLGVAPRGYDQYGPKVKDIRFYSPTQKILINNEGELFKKAWQWKLQGEKDHIIMAKLFDLGLVIKKQALSDMWRNPFYAGLVAHKLLDGDVVKGNWEPIVKPNDYMMVQEILKVNNAGYKQDKANPNRPLTGFVRCAGCGNKLTGYEVKAKGLHYYKCQGCVKGSINAHTNTKSKDLGADDLFQGLLSSLEPSDRVVDIFKQQLRLSYETLSGETKSENEVINEQLKKLATELKELKVRNAKGLIDDKEIYNELKSELEGKIDDLKLKLIQTDSKISNLDRYIDMSVDVVSNISKYWGLNNIEVKKRTQELVFPEGLSLDIKNRRYLTKNVNLFFLISSVLSMDTEGINDKKQPISRLLLSLPYGVVAGTRLERATFGL